MAENIMNSATDVAVSNGMQYQDHLRDFENIVYFTPQNCEKRLLASSYPSARPHGTTGLSLDGFLLNLIFECFSKIFLGKSMYH